MTLQKRLQQALDHTGKKRAELAKAARVSRPTLTQWLNGDIKDMRSPTLFAAADFLGVNARWLATGKGQMTPDSQAIAEALTEDAITLAGQYDTLSEANKARLQDYLKLLQQ